METRLLYDRVFYHERGKSPNVNCFSVPYSQKKIDRNKYLVTMNKIPDMFLRSGDNKKKTKKKKRNKETRK